MHTRTFALGVLLSWLGPGCVRGQAPPPMGSSSPDRVADDEPSISTQEAPVLTPVVLAPYEGGSSCSLVLRDGNLYWTMQGFAARPESTSGSTKDAGKGARGAVLDCSRTRGSIHRVDVRGGPDEIVAETDEWPWTLGASDEALYFIGYCSHGLWSVPRAGGAPTRIGRHDATTSDHFASQTGVLVADRFGGSTGVFQIDPLRGRTELVAAKGRRPWLLGRLGDRVYWGELEGLVGTAYAAVGPSDRRVMGSFHGMPMDIVARDDALFVLTTQRVLRIEGVGIHELAPVSEYGDRGSLAVDAHHAYWANGKPGTLSRLDLVDDVRHEVHVGGKPCGVAVDDDAVYWLDRGRRAVMRAPLAVFDTPARPPPEEPSLESPAEPLTAPPPGLELKVEASPVRLRDGWGVDLQLHAYVFGPQTFILGSAPAPHLSGERRAPDGSGSGFADGCYASGGRDDAELGPGERRTLSHRYGNGTREAIEPGGHLELQVGLCDVGLPNGRWMHIPAATVVVDVPKVGRPRITVTHAVSRPAPD